MNKIEVTCPGRISFAGEKLDWMVGGNGITCAMDATQIVGVISDNGTNEVRMVSTTTEGSEFQEKITLPLTESDKLTYLTSVLIAFQRMGTVIEDGVDIKLTSSIPSGLGMSSSAALCVSLAAAISEKYSLKLDKTQLAHIAYIAEKEILGMRCGQLDQHAVSFGGTCSVNSSTIPATVQKFPNVLAENIFFIASPGVEKKTNSVNAIIQQKLLDKDPQVMKYIEETTGIVQLITELLNSSNFSVVELGKAITQAHFLLSDCLSVSTVILDNIVRNAINAGAYGAKLGSGKGGVVFAIADAQNQDSVEQAISVPGFRVIKSRMNLDGVKSLSDGFIS